LLRAFELSRLLNCSRSQLHELDRAGYVPSPILFGESRVWRVAEIRDWITAGCPERSDWKWRPSVAVKLDDLMELRRRERDALVAEVRELEERKARGESVALVGVRP
jgi:predicted DNA-binding transcriptional regulator AlpA